MRLLSVVLGLVFCASQSLAATVDVVFDDTPLYVKGSGAIQNPSQTLIANYSDTVDGRVRFHIANNGQTDLLGTVFFPGIETVNFDSPDAKETRDTHRFALAFGNTGTRFHTLNLRAGRSFSLNTSSTSLLALQDFAAIDTGVLLVEYGTQNSSIFQGSAAQPGMTTRVQMSAVPLPAGSVLILTGLGALAYGRWKTRKAA